MLIPEVQALAAAARPQRGRAVGMLRPVGHSRWAMAAWLAAGLGVILAVSAALGHANVGSAVALGFVLTAVPSIPLSWRPALAIMAIRGTTVLIGAVLAMLTAGHPVAFGAATIAAALCGGLLERVGPTAGLAVVLVTIDEPVVAQGVSLDALLPYAVGVAVVVLAWVAWYASAHSWRLARRRPRSTATEAPSRPWRESYPHALRVGVAVSVAVALAAMLPATMVGGHWLITSVLLTVQPTAADTGLRLAQRLSGNTVGALIAAVVLGSQPAIAVVAIVAVVLFTLAMALRPVNYTWWAVTGPPVLLMISTYPGLFPWYEGGVRLAMNLAGAAIVLIIVFAVPAVRRIGARTVRARFRHLPKSDSVYKIQSWRV